MIALLDYARIYRELPHPGIVFLIRPLSPISAATLRPARQFPKMLRPRFMSARGNTECKASHRA